MIPILYEENERFFTNNGICRLRDCVRCEVTEERNGIYEIEFDYPIDGAHFSEIIPGRIIAVEHDDNGDIQPFDIYGYSKPLSGVVTFKGQHISYRQNRITVSGTNINSLSSAFSLFATGSPSNPFSYESDIVTNNYVSSADGTPRTVREMLGGVEGSLLDAYGGEYVFDKFNVRLLRRRGVDRSFTIRYGVNLVDYNEELDCSESYTAVIPYWQGIDSNNLPIIVKGTIVDSGFTLFGRTLCVPLDLTDKFEDQPTIVQLTSMAQSVMADSQPYLSMRNITVNFVRLTDSDEYARFAKLQDCRLCDTINVVIPKFDIESAYKIVSVTWDVLGERYTQMDLGTLAVSLSEALGVKKGK